MEASKNQNNISEIFSLVSDRKTKQEKDSKMVSSVERGRESQGEAVNNGKSSSNNK